MNQALDAFWERVGQAGNPNERLDGISQECYDAMGDEATNLIVERLGTKRADEIVLFGAHCDTVFRTLWPMTKALVAGG